MQPSSGKTTYTTLITARRLNWTVVAPTTGQQQERLNRANRLDETKAA